MDMKQTMDHSLYQEYIVIKLDLITSTIKDLKDKIADVSVSLNEVVENMAQVKADLEALPTANS